MLVEIGASERFVAAHGGYKDAILGSMYAAIARGGWINAFSPARSGGRCNYRDEAFKQAMEGAAHNVRCNVLHPGFIDTPMLAGAPEAARAHMAAITPQKRVGRVEEAAAVAAFLLSDDASHVTAQDLAVDGGLLGTLAL